MVERGSSKNRTLGGNPIMPGCECTVWCTVHRTGFIRGPIGAGSHTKVALAYCLVLSAF